LVYQIDILTISQRLLLITALIFVKHVASYHLIFSMKKHYLLLSAAMLLAGAAHAQGTELFLSEYDEGAHQSNTNYGGTKNSTGNERALEIYNPTTSSVSLNAYSLRRYSNGSSTPVDEERLMSKAGATENKIERDGTFVYVNGEASLPVLLNAANQLGPAAYNTKGPNYISGGGATYGNVSYFNGDDALALVRYSSGTAGVGTGIIIDIFGVIGNQPVLLGGAMGTGRWSGTNPADPKITVNGAEVLPYVESANQSLIRRYTVSTGNRTNIATSATDPKIAAYNIADEWMTYSAATPQGGTQSVPPGKDQSYSRLGEHSDYDEHEGPHGSYTALATLKEFNDGISVYPNPATGKATVEIRGVKVGRLTVMNALGQNISVQPRGLATEKVLLDVSKLRAGVYFVQCLSTDGQLKVYKELVVQ
jgi:hypothetical protein